MAERSEIIRAEGALPALRRLDGVERVMDMTSFFERNAGLLQDFARLSQSVGARRDYVQGGGGNTSVKLDEQQMAVKASGYCLGDITPQSAYAVMDYAALRAFYADNDPAMLEGVEQAGSERAKAGTLAVEGLKQLRPSVEAGVSFPVRQIRDTQP